MRWHEITRKILFAILIGSTLILAITILTDWLPLLRGPAPGTSEWYWPYLLRPFQRWWPSATVAALMLAVGAWWLSREGSNRRQDVLALIALSLGSLFLQVTLIYADREAVSAELVDRTLSNQASGFFEPAADIEDINTVLSSYPQEMPGFVSEHARTHPPGIIAANWFAIRVFEKMDNLSEPIARFVRPLRCMDLWLLERPASVSAALGLWSVLPLLFGAATIFPAYAVANQLLSGKASQLATILACTIPALILFAPKSVQFYAPLSLLLFWTFHAGLSARSTWKLLIAGFIASILTFLSMGNGALILMLLLYASFLILFIFRERTAMVDGFGNLTHLTVQLLTFGIGAVWVWLLYWLIWGVAPWDIAQVGLNQHYQLVTNLRSYEWWVGWNLVDVLVFSGWPLVLGFLGSLILAFHLWRQRGLEATEVLALALGTTIVFLNISGTARGEVGRLWLFLMPLLAFPAARFWTRALPGKGQVITIVALQLLMVLCLGWSWRPVRTVIVVAEPPTMKQETPEVMLNQDFAGEPLALAGYSLDSAKHLPGEILALTLFWQSDGPASRPFTVFNHLVDENGQVLAQQDNWPVEGQWPPTCWQAGEIIVDEYAIKLPRELEPGSYHLLTGLYDRANGSRVTLPNGLDVIELGTILISAP